MEHETTEQKEKILKIIYPQRLLNRKRLRTTQTWIDYEKMEYAIEGKDIPPIEYIPKADIWYPSSGDEIYVMRDGNHRTGMACLKKEEIVIQINNVIYGDGYPLPSYGFNMITQGLRSELAMEQNIDGLQNILRVI